MVCSIIIISAWPKGIMNSTKRKDAMAFHQYFFFVIIFFYLNVLNVSFCAISAAYFSALLQFVAIVTYTSAFVANFYIGIIPTDNLQLEITPAVGRAHHVGVE